jgi:hypothetical protein
LLADFCQVDSEKKYLLEEVEMFCGIKQAGVDSPVKQSEKLKT